MACRASSGQHRFESWRHPAFLAVLGDLANSESSVVDRDATTPGISSLPSRLFHRLAGSSNLNSLDENAGTGILPDRSGYKAVTSATIDRLNLPSQGPPQLLARVSRSVKACGPTREGPAIAGPPESGLMERRMITNCGSRITDYEGVAWKGQRLVTTGVSPWFGRGTSNLARQCDLHAADRAHARGWRTFVPSEPRAQARGHNAQ